MLGTGPIYCSVIRRWKHLVHDAENDNVKSPKEGKNLMKITGDDTLGYRILGVKQEKGLSEAATFTPWCETVFSHHGCGSQ
jgi:hypothetical protein